MALMRLPYESFGGGSKRTPKTMGHCWIDIGWTLFRCVACRVLEATVFVEAEGAKFVKILSPYGRIPKRSL